MKCDESENVKTVKNKQQKIRDATSQSLNLPLISDVDAYCVYFKWTLCRCRSVIAQTYVNTRQSEIRLKSNWNQAETRSKADSVSFVMVVVAVAPSQRPHVAPDALRQCRQTDVRSGSTFRLIWSKLDQNRSNNNRINYK